MKTVSESVQPPSSKYSSLCQKDSRHDDEIFEQMPQESKSHWRCCTVLIQPPIQSPSCPSFGSHNGSNIFSLESHTRHGVIHIASLQVPVVTALMALAQSLRVVGFGCGLAKRAERVGFWDDREVFCKVAGRVEAVFE